MEFVTIASFTLPHEAAVPRALLESEGIECYLRNESTVQAYNFYSNAIGGVMLQVKTEDAERAIEILRSGGFLGGTAEKSVLVEDDPEPWKIDGQSEEEKTELPKQKKASWPGITIGIVLLLGGAFLTYKLAGNDGPPKIDYEEVLTKSNWSVNEIIRSQQETPLTLLKPPLPGLPPIGLKPERYSHSTPGSGQKLIFISDGQLIFSAHQAEKGRWEIRDDTLIMIASVHQEEIPSGLYRLRLINDRNLSFQTDTLSIFLLKR